MGALQILLCLPGPAEPTDSKRSRQDLGPKARGGSGAVRGPKVSCAAGPKARFRGVSPRRKETLNG